MKIDPINFKGIYKYTKPTSYGKCLYGQSSEYNYSIHVNTDTRTGRILHKLYYVTKKNNWVKSFLRFFSDDKAYKEIRSYASGTKSNLVV